MPNNPSTKKRMRQAESRRALNRDHRSRLRSAIKQVRTASSKKEAETLYREAEVLLDRAARKNLVHRNAAARLKNRLQKSIRQKS